MGKVLDIAKVANNTNPQSTNRTRELDFCILGIIFATKAADQTSYVNRSVDGSCIYVDTVTAPSSGSLCGIHIVIHSKFYVHQHID